MSSFTIGKRDYMRCAGLLAGIAEGTERAPHHLWIYGKAIRHEQERIRLLRLLESLTGKYCTKRIEPDLQSMFPEYKVVYLHKEYSNRLEVVISNPGMDYWYDAYHLTIANQDTRRVDADKIKEQIESTEKEIKRLEGLYSGFRDQAMQFTNLLGYMKSLAQSMDSALTVACRKDPGYQLRNLSELCNKLRW